MSVRRRRSAGALLALAALLWRPAAAQSVVDDSGRALRLRGKGLPGGAENANGDILLTLKIMLPAHGDPDLTSLARRWRDEKPYDPRKS